MAQAAALGEGKVSIRADFEALQGDLDKAAKIIERSFGTAGRIMRNTGAAITAGLSVPIAGLIGKSTLAAARVDELSSINQILGETAGYSAPFIKKQTQAVISQGIEAAAANETIADFIKSNLDIADAAKVARVAQDAAVISGQNSTEVTRQLTTAIVTGRTELFKSAGLVIDLQQAYDAYGESIGKSGRQLSEAEKLQARMNATIEYGTRIAGAYEKAMEQPGKVLRSYPRYLNEIFVELGQNFTPAFKVAVEAGADFLKTMRENIAEGGKWSGVFQEMGQSLEKFATIMKGVLEKFTEMDPAVFATIMKFVQLGAVLGPLMLVGGQTMIWVSNLIKAFGGLAGAVGLSKAALLGIAGPVGWTVAGLLALGGAYTYAWEKSKQVERSLVDQQEVITDTTETYEEYIEAQRALARESGRALHVIEEGGRVYMAGSQYITAMSEAWWEADRAQRELTKSMIASDDHMVKMAEQHKGAAEHIREVAEAFDEAAMEQARFNEAISGTLGQNIEKYKETMTDLANQLWEVRSRIKSLEGLQRRGLLDDVGEEELQNLITKYGELQDQIDAVAEEHERATARIIFGILSQQIALMELPFEETMALLGGVAEAWGLVDESTARVWDQTSELLSLYLAGKITIQEFVAEMDKIKDKTVRIDMKYSWSGNAGPGYQTSAPGPGIDYDNTPIPNYAGGPIYPSDLSMVGERGPELFIPNSAGAIISNHTLRNLLKGSYENTSHDDVPSEVTVYANVNSEIDIYQLARRVAEEIRRSS
jgi:hypothetical protein